MAYNQKWCDMDAVNWDHSPSLTEPINTISMSDNLLEFVRNEDLVKGFAAQDEILPLDLFNEIINEFDFGDDNVNMNSLMNDVNQAAGNQIMQNSQNEFITKVSEDPLLSSSNTNINYNLTQSATVLMPTIQIPSSTNTSSTVLQNNSPMQNIDSVKSVSSALPQMISSKNVSSHFTSSNVLASQANCAISIAAPSTTVVYHISNNSVCSTPFVTSSPANQTPHQTLLNNLTPIQMVLKPATTGPITTAVAQPMQKYRKIAEKNQVKDNNKSILLAPTVMYADSTTTTEYNASNGQNIRFIDTSGGTTILTTHIPMATIMVEQETPSKANQSLNDCGSPVPKVKEVKRYTHNAIERRYRTSINDKIVELKNMLVGDAGKLNKSSILKKSIEKITDLENENCDLKMENARLRELLNASNANTDVITNATGDNSTLKHLLLQRTVNQQQKRRYTHSSGHSDYGKAIDCMTPPPTSDESNPSLSPARSDTRSMSPLANEEISTDIARSSYANEDNHRSAKRSKKTTVNNASSNHGMSTLSKLTLCVFMFAIVTINPLASLFTSDVWSSSNAENLFEQTVSTSRRTILGATPDTSFLQSLWLRFTDSLLIFALNLLILTVCMIKLCFYSDPIMNFRSPIADEYFKQRQFANAEFDRGNADAAFVAYKKCLQMFGVTLPQSWIEVAAMTIWQFLRCCVHRLRFGQWFSRKCSGIFRSTDIQSDAFNSAQELAIVLNRCNQINLSRNVRNGCGLILSMYAVNMAEVAANIAPLNLIDIYLTAALRCRRNYPYFFSWICSRYYFYKAKSTSSAFCGAKLPRKYNWIFNNVYGYKFICNYRFNGGEEGSNGSLFCSDVNSLDPLSTVFRDYNEHLLKCALHCLIGVSSTANCDIKSLQYNNATVINDVLNYAELLKENCEDPLTLWWAHLFSIDAMWLLGEDVSAEHMIDLIEVVPRTLIESKDSLARAAITVFHAKKLLGKRIVMNASETLTHCNAASKLLEESLAYNKITKSDMILLVQLLICDWLLETRTSCWDMEQTTKATDEENMENYSPVTSQVLEQFQNDLNSLYCVIDQVPIAKSRIYLYEAVSRLMAGAAPGHTQELLDRSAHEQYRRNIRSAFHCGGNGGGGAANNTTDDSANRRRCGQSAAFNLDGERERASAMYVACKYLPTPLLCLPGERAGMLAEAAKTLKKIGNRKKLNDCYQLMKSFNPTTVSTN